MGIATGTLAEEIRKAKAAAGMLQAEIGRRTAEVLGREKPFHQTVVGAWLRDGDSTPDIYQLLALDEVFGLEHGTLLERSRLIAKTDVLTAVNQDPLLDASAKEVLRRIYILTLDEVSRTRATTLGAKDDVIDDSLTRHYLAWIERRLRGWKSRSEPIPGPVTPDELSHKYSPYLPRPDDEPPTQRKPERPETSTKQPSRMDRLIDSVEELGASIKDQNRFAVVHAAKMQSDPAYRDAWNRGLADSLRKTLAVLDPSDEDTIRFLSRDLEATEEEIAAGDLYASVKARIDPAKWKLVQRDALTAARAYVALFRKNGWPLGSGEDAEIASVLKQALSNAPSGRPEDVRAAIAQILKTGKRLEWYPEDLPLVRELVDAINEKVDRIRDDVGVTGQDSVTAWELALGLASAWREAGEPLTPEIVGRIRHELGKMVAEKTDQGDIETAMQEWVSESTGGLDQRFSEARNAWSEQVTS